MRDNPILTALKVVGFGVLTLLVAMSFWQQTKQEDRLERVNKELSTVKEAVSSAATRGDLNRRKIGQALDKHTKAVDRLGKQVARLSAGGARVTATAGESDPLPPDLPLEDGKPEHLTGKARELWGRYPDFLKPDPNWPVNPDLDDPKVDPNGKVVMWYGGKPPDLNPLTRSDGAINRYIRIPAEEYWGWGHSQYPYDYKHGLAIRCEVNEDYTEWVIWVRPEVKWHKPQVDLDKYQHLRGEHHVTAHDWKFTIDLIMNPDVRSPHIRSYFSELESCEVIDDHCFVMRWKKKQFNSIDATVRLVAPIPKFIFSKDERGNEYEASQLGTRFNDHWFSKGFNFCGCGPYYVVEFDPSRRLLLRRNDEYFGPLPPIREIERQIFPNRELAYTKLESGEFTGTSLLPNVWKKRVEDGPADSPYKKMAEYWGWSIQYSFIAWNNIHPIFKSVKVRHAMTHACNRKRVLETLRLGRGMIATGPQYVHAVVCPKDIEPLPFDLDRSRKLLAEEGWADSDGDGVLEKTVDGTTTEFRVTAMIPDNEEFKKLFEIFKEDLAKLGVQMAIEPLQWTNFVQKLNDRDFEVTALLWSTNGWDDDLYQIWHSSQVDEPESSNFISFRDDEVDRLIEQARETFDPDERIKIQGAAHRRVHSLQPYTFMNTIQLPTMYWPDELSDFEAAVRWKNRPFARMFPLFVPAK